MCDVVVVGVGVALSTQFVLQICPWKERQSAMVLEILPSAGAADITHTHTVHVLSIQPVSTVNIWTQRFSGSYRWTLNSVSHITLDSLPKAWGSDPLIIRAGDANIRPAGQN